MPLFPRRRHRSRGACREEQADVRRLPTEDVVVFGERLQRGDHRPLRPRRVAACAEDAARIATRENPEVSTGYDGSTEVPSGESGSTHDPYRSGYDAAELASRLRGPI